MRAGDVCSALCLPTHQQPGLACSAVAGDALVCGELDDGAADWTFLPTARAARNFLIALSSGDSGIVWLVSRHRVIGAPSGTIASSAVGMVNESVLPSPSLLSTCTCPPNA